QKADHAGGRENAISLGRTRPPLSRRAWRNRHHQRGTLSPGCYRCCATAKRNAPTFDHNLSASERAAFIAESIQGVGGCIVFPDGYLKHTYEHVRSAGGVCIADEVQAGFGRTGTHYWGFETQGVIPDIVTMAKGIGNGCPLAAVVTTPQIASVLAKRIHFNTFGGNPVVCAQGKAVLEVIEKEKLQENALKVGNHLLAGLEKLKQKHELIGDVRGRGLMIGVELVKDRNTKEPAKAECAEIMELCREMGLLIGKGGLWGQTIRIKPPLCITQADGDFLLDVLDAAFTKLSSPLPAKPH